MKRFLLLALVLSVIGSSAAAAGQRRPMDNDFPRMVRVRLWYLHPPQQLQVQAAVGQATTTKCEGCKAVPVTGSTVRATASTLQLAAEHGRISELRFNGTYDVTAEGEPRIHADFPVEVRAVENRLQVTATIPMEEYVAGILAGETGTFQSDEALKAMAVAARTFAVHFGSRHALDGFDFCDSTHCQNLRLSDVNARFRRIADATAGEVLWYEGEPAATYYFANCGGRTEDGRYILGSDEAPAPYLKQHSDQYCVRNGGAQWSSSISKRDLQDALEADGIAISGRLRNLTIVQRTPSGRVELVRVTGSNSVMLPGVVFRSAVGRHIGWDRLKSNWYEVSDHGAELSFHGRGFGHGVGLCQVGAEVMGEEGHSYREILAFYYPGTHLGVSAQGTPWQQLANEDLELLTTRPDRDRSLLPIATRYLHQAEDSTGLVFRAKPRLKVYATVADFRNSSGEPGWVAASTRGRTIQLQPPDVLSRSGSLDQTLRHEFLHMLVDSYMHPGTPRWFREGLVLYLSGAPDKMSAQGPGDVATLESSLRSPKSETELRQAYAEARSRVALLVQQHGKDVVLEWLQEGLPAELASAQGKPLGAR